MSRVKSKAAAPIFLLDDFGIKFVEGEIDLEICHCLPGISYGTEQKNFACQQNTDVSRYQNKIGQTMSRIWLPFELKAMVTFLNLDSFTNKVSKHEAPYERKGTEINSACHPFFFIL